MKWGTVASEYSGFGWKRLSSHEIDPNVSNGHEFQGVAALVELLGDQPRKEIPTCYYLIGDDLDGNPVVKNFTRSLASWYDSRARDEKRSREWRLYYFEEDWIQVKCNAGDLIIVGRRNDGSLSVLLIEANTCAETSIINLLGIGRVPARGRGHTRVIDATDRDIGLSAAETLEHLASSMTSFGDAPPPFPAPDPQISGDPEVEEIAAKMISKWEETLGSCQEVAELIISHCSYGPSLTASEPDAALMRWLEAAEASYRLWERHYFSGFLKPLRYDSTVSDEVLAETISTRWMSLRQGRVSRAGRMMELFLVEVFRAAKLRFDWGAKIEGGKLPDFLFPSVNDYQNDSFPANRLRILGSKTSFKDRWRQILSEADRVKIKRGVTRDDSITRSIFAQMERESFVVVMPAPIKATYPAPPENLISLAEFINETRQVCS